MPEPIRAAWHELRCRECRVSWRSWWQRIRGNPRGMSPWRRGLEERYEEVRLAVEEGREMPCPAVGGLLCGADDCLANGCIEERPDA